MELRRNRMYLNLTVKKKNNAELNDEGYVAILDNNTQSTK